MLIFIFRHTTIKTFFLSVLAGVLLTIISGLILVFNHSNEETTLLSFMILYYVIFAILALSILKINSRQAIQGIGLNLFLFMTPFIPLIFLALYKASRYRDLYNQEEYFFDDPEKKALYFLIAEITGSVILLILIQPLFKKLYRKWYSAPEE
jgi:multisubunit Na+/H+ antiporter MnhG subunit